MYCDLFADQFSASAQEPVWFFPAKSKAPARDEIDRPQINLLSLFETSLSELNSAAVIHPTAAS